MGADDLNDVLGPNNDVYRVIEPRPIHLPDGAKYPTWDAFNPSSKDKSRIPVRVSVWDSAKTPAARAVEFRMLAYEGDKALAKSEFQAYELKVSTVSAVGAAHDNERMRVVYDPTGVPETIAHLPGADGHSGIEGLDRSAKTPRPKWKDMLRALADHCKPVPK